MKNKLQPIIGFKFGEVILIVAITSVFSVFAGISYGKIKYSNTQTKNITSIKNEQQEPLQEFIEHYEFIINNYYDKKNINEKELLSTALSSIVNKLGIDDPFSTYLDEEENDSLTISLNGSYEGIGIEAAKLTDVDYISINKIIDNSPASKVDLKIGDYIVSIDGKDTKTMTLNDFSEYIKNEESSSFLLKVLRDDKTFNVKLERSKVELSSVSSRVFEIEKQKIGYLKLSIFASNSYNQFKKELKQLEKEKVSALVIDLRDNTGGHLTEAKKIISLFVGKRKVIYQLEKDNDIIKYYSTGQNDYTKPIVFVTNKSTASASEVFIMGVKDNLGATTVGTQTYGKGTVQELITLSNGDKYKITTKKWLSPKGKWVNDTKGIVADVKEDISKEYLSSPIEANDNQLKAALKAARKLVK